MNLLPYYPQLRFGPEGVRLYNPLLRKRYANRPEERVRLRFVDMLLHGAGFPGARIGFEVAVPAEHREATTRADLILYGPDFKPWVLVECKAPEVPVTEATAIQAAQYNRVVGADHVVLTNGVTLVCARDGAICDMPDEIRPQPDLPPRDAAYWLERGFLSPETATPEMAEFCERHYGGRYPVRWGEVPAPGWQAAVDGRGLCVSQGQVVWW
jgi:hypothetical protein